MRIKTFYAKTMPEAMRLIKSHMGPDALILSSKEVPRRSGVWGRSPGFEVVAAVDRSEDMDVYSPSREPGTVMEETAPLTVQEPDASASLRQDLVKSGVNEALARQLLESALQRLTPAQRRSRRALIRSAGQAALDLLAEPSGQDGLPGRKVVAFVGPTGVGKTTSLAKLAACLALQKKKRIVLMTMDGYRIGAVEQLRSYAGLMGVPFRFVGQVSDLSGAIEEHSQRDYILIDTAGHGPRDMESMGALASFLKASDFVERHLVLSAATRPSDLREAMDRFEVCRPDHLLFTKLDETSTPGHLLNELVRTQKSFSYYSDGQRVPDDLHAVPRERILDIVLNPNETD